MCTPVQSTEHPQQVLLWAQYPDGRYGAVVQTDGRAVYFGVQSLSEGQAAGRSRWVWVRNLSTAPLLFPAADGEGEAMPLLPEGYVRDPAPQPPLDLDRTFIVWFEQGMGAALIEGDRLLALIPPGPTAEQTGFAADCLRASAVAWPLRDEELYQDMVPGLEDYWRQWATDNPLVPWHRQLLPVYESAFGQVTQQYAGESGTWPPLRVAQFHWRNRIVLLTVGAGLRRQPAVERELLNYVDHQRLELGIMVGADLPSEAAVAYARWLIGLARYPWHHETCFLPSHTIAVWPPVGQTSAAKFAAGDSAMGASTPGQSAAGSSLPGESAVGQWLGETQVAARLERSTIDLPELRAQAVNLLWLWPESGSAGANDSGPGVWPAAASS